MPDSAKVGALSTVFEVSGSTTGLSALSVVTEVSGSYLGLSGYSVVVEVGEQVATNTTPRQQGLAGRIVTVETLPFSTLMPGYSLPGRN